MSSIDAKNKIIMRKFYPILNIKLANGKKTILITLSFLAICLIWGSTFLAIKVVVETAPAFFSMGVRFVCAALILMIFLPFAKQLEIKRNQIINTSLLGVLYFSFCMGLVAWAEKVIPSGIACVLSGLIPLWFLIFDMILNKRSKPRSIVWFGLVSGFVGIIVLVGLDDFGNIGNIPLLSVFAIIAASILWSFTSVLSPKVDKPKNRILNLSVQMLAGGIVSIIVSLISNELNNFTLEDLTYNSMIALGYLTIFGSIIALLAFNYLLDNVSPGLISTYSYINPIVALILGWLILNEEINIRIIIASGLILVGIAFIKIGDKPSKKRKLNKIMNNKKAA
jgi:drug/metabolite transporter (DMT)-like permease